MPVSLSTIMTQNSAKGSRYTVTRPLTALFAISLPSAIGAFAVGAPLWVGSSFAIAGLLVLVVHLATYVYCVINDRDAIRRESFTIDPPAIEKSLTVDDISTLSAAKTKFIDDHTTTSPTSNVRLIEPAE